MRKLTHKVRHALHCVAHNKAAKHGHHMIYLVYYGLALLDDTGARFWVVLGIFTFHALSVATGEE